MCYVIVVLYTDGATTFMSFLVLHAHILHIPYSCTCSIHSRVSIDAPHSEKGLNNPKGEKGGEARVEGCVRGRIPSCGAVVVCVHGHGRL